MRTLGQLRTWTLRRWITAAVVAAAFVFFMAIPTALIDTGLFTRMIDAPWWVWPALIVAATLAGLTAATYVAPPAGMRPQDDAAPQRRGLIGGFLTFFAVGCPVCNKLVLLALGTSGALNFFEPLQPVLVIAALAMLAWALRTRLSAELSCPTLENKAS